MDFETDLNGDSRGTFERGLSLGWFAGPVLPVQEILSCLGFSSPSRPVLARLAVVPRHQSPK
jgi:hypothetical protein